MLHTLCRVTLSIWAAFWVVAPFALIGAAAGALDALHGDMPRFWASLGCFVMVPAIFFAPLAWAKEWDDFGDY